jgi:hypothetical protein
MMHDGLADDGAKPGHPIGEPFGNMAAVKRQIGAAGASWHGDVRPEKLPLEHKESASLGKVNNDR